MNTFEFKSLFDLLQAFPTEQSCIEYLELCRWKNGIVSPYDPASKVYNYGGGKYRCKNTGLNFNVKTGTVFQKSKVPLIKWLWRYGLKRLIRKEYLPYNCRKTFQ